MIKQEGHICKGSQQQDEAAEAESRGKDSGGGERLSSCSFVVFVVLWLAIFFLIIFTTCLSAAPQELSVVRNYYYCEFC